MIVTVTPNPAVDVTYRVPRLRVHGTHRVTEVTQIAGGKGINVASVLTLRGVPVLASGLLGGPAGERVRADLDGRGIPHDFAACGGETRRSVAVVSETDGDATVFNEPGAEVARAEWEGFVAHLGRALERVHATVVVASGSLPPGVPVDGYAQVVAVARRHGARVIVDTSGEPLLAALASGPDLVKPNRAELREATREADPVTGARSLQTRGARDVLVSLGDGGLLLLGADGGTARARLPRRLRGNPTGAGDAAVAAVAARLAAGGAAADALAEAVAWSAAAVLHPLAGHLNEEDAASLLSQVVLDPAPGPSADPTAQITPPQEEPPC